ncbi:hypothetical protein [Veillonella nakazawae]|uniref:hypothetical protein n=1 Tax=Veillonella nakazawae TaxID=2682456 RepID=UPI00399353E7
MGTVWRLQTRTDSKDSKKISRYCLDHKVAALGWSIKDDHINKYNPEAITEIQEKRKKIKNIEGYYDVVRTYGLYGINNKKRLIAVDMLLEVEKGDYIWMRDNGIYYLGYVGDKLRYKYNSRNKALEHDAANQIKGVVWKPIGDESQVPGAVATAFIRGRTIQRINKSHMFEYAEYAFWEKPLILENSNKDFLQQLFYDCLSPNDCEDLVCLYLYDRKGYVTIPSTNKIATELYECVLVNPLNGKLAYPQVKKGDVELNTNKYIDLIKDNPNKEVYLFSSEDKVVGETHIDNIHIISSDELYSWAKEKIDGNSFLIPEGIVKWYELIHSSKNS